VTILANASDVIRSDTQVAQFRLIVFLKKVIYLQSREMSRLLCDPKVRYSFKIVRKSMVKGKIVPVLH
jgi:hypothetical protein